MDALLEGVFGDDFSDEVPDLVAFFGAEEDEPSGGVEVEEGHAIDHEVMFGEFEGVAFLLILGDDSEAEPAFFCAFFSDVVEGEEGAVVGQFNSVLQVILDFSDLLHFEGLVPGRYFKEVHNEPEVDAALYGLVFEDHGHPVVDAVETDVPHVLAELYTADLEVLVALEQTGYLNCSCEVPFFHEFFERDRHPLSLLAHENFTVFGVFAPGPPLPLPLLLHVVEEDLGGGGAHGVVVPLVAHHNQLIFLLEPGHFLNVRGFHHVLVFLGGFHLLEQVID